MKCQKCGKDIQDNEYITYQGLCFCNNLCRRTFERTSTQAQAPRQSSAPTPATATPGNSLHDSPPPAATLGTVHFKEHLYLALKVLFTLGFIALIAFAGYRYPSKAPTAIGVMGIYVGAILFFVFFRSAILTGFIRANAIKISKKQFPDIERILIEQSQQMGLKKTPELFALQAGGLLNALALRFAGKNYIVLFSDVLEIAYSQGASALSFIIAHELAHIKRNHSAKRLILFPSLFVPFLEFAYSRACEYTCDNFAATLNPAGARTGLAILTIGKNLFLRMNIDAFADQLQETGGFSTWLAEIFSTHPHTSKRLKALSDNPS